MDVTEIDLHTTINLKLIKMCTAWRILKIHLKILNFEIITILIMAKCLHMSKLIYIVSGRS